MDSDDGRHVLALAPRGGLSDSSKLDNSSTGHPFNQELAVTCLLEEPAENVDYVDSDHPDVDVVHVLGIGNEDSRLSLDMMFDSTIKTKRRELSFSLNILDLLVDGFSVDSIERQAVVLLTGIQKFREKDDQSRKRAIIVVAYDVGVLVVKKAISLTRLQSAQWPDLYRSVSHVVFVGCFHRFGHRQTFPRQMFNFLSENKRESWERALTPATVASLMSAISEMHDCFIASKITLRSRIISLYASQDETGILHSSMTFPIAVVGLINEFSIQERVNSQKERFPALKRLVSEDMQHWIRCDQWSSIECALLSLAHPQPRLLSSPPSPTHPICKTPEFRDWSQARGVCVLFVHGEDYEVTRHAAEQAFYGWKATQPEEENPGYMLSFCFSSFDPLRDGGDDMAASLLLQILGGKRADGGEYRILEDQYELHRSWTKKELIMILLKEIFQSFTSSVGQIFLVLEHWEECDQESQETFMETLERLAGCWEGSLKVLLSSISKALPSSTQGRRDKSSTSSALGVFHHETVGETHMNDDDYLNTLFSTYSASGYGDGVMREALKHAAVVLESDSLKPVLKLLESHTDWPHCLSKSAFSEFLSLLQGLAVGDTPTIVLDRILRSFKDQDRLRWILAWLLTAYRPFSRRELATILCFCNRPVELLANRPTLIELSTALNEIDTWLRVLVHVDCGQLAIRAEVWKIFKEADDNDKQDLVWTESHQRGTATIISFLIKYFQSAAVQTCLNTRFQDYYQDVADADGEIVPAIVVDVDDPLFYNVLAFAHLASQKDSLWFEVRSLLSANDGPFTCWAQMYWAMDNPFSRPPFDISISPLQIFLSSAFCVVAPADPQSCAGFIDTFSLNQLDYENPMKSLERIMRAADKPAALELARKILEVYHRTLDVIPGIKDRNHEAIQWPSWLIWRATFLNMPEMTEFLLCHGVDPNPKTPLSRFYPSPLYMACRLGHSAVVQTLLDFGARTDVRRDSMYTPFYAAVGNGNREVIQILATRDPSLIEEKQPMKPIYAASVLAAWGGVEVLLEHHASPNAELQSGQTDDEWAPLIAAAESGYTRCVRLLLEGGADPNITGPSGHDTPLWFACIRAASVECVQLLLQHGADPNDPAIVPPLLIEMMNSREISDTTCLTILELVSTSSSPLQLNVEEPSSGVTPLMIAAREGKVGMVRWLLEQGADVSLLDIQNRSALWYAIKKRDLKGVQEILRWDPPLDILTGDGEPLLEAALEDNAILKCLLDAGAPIDLCNGQSVPAINVAVVQRNVKAVKCLLERQPNLEYQDAAGWTPIMDAVGYVHSAEITRLLVEGGANLQSTNSSRRGVLHFAMSTDPNILRVLLEFRKLIDFNICDDDGNSPLHLGRDAYLTNVLLLLRAGADINARNQKKNTALIRAMIAGEQEIFNIFLKQPDIDLNAIVPSLGTALVIACRTLDVEMVVRLINAKANLEASGPVTNPLMAACLPYTGFNSIEGEKTRQILALLLSRGANIAATHPSIFSNVLSVACLATTPRTINYLLDEGASTQIADPLGRLPIHLAAANGLGNFQAMMSAMEDMDVMAADHTGKNALHWAAQFGHAQTICEIFRWIDRHTQQKRERYVNQPDQDGWTPLCWAARPFTGGWAADMQTEPRNYLETVRVLLDNKADPTCECSIGTGSVAEKFTPLKLAERCGAEDEMLQLLRCPPKHQGINDERHDPQRKYTSLDSVTCDTCLITIFGLRYKCQSCVDFDVCQKCYSHHDIYHKHYRDLDQQPHVFELRLDTQEFQDPPSTPSLSASPSPSPQQSPLVWPEDQSSHGDYLGDDDREINDFEANDQISLDL